ncbi:mandelate racemase/muconate lactonizing enzyme family protein [Halodesulfurarchaeum sp.]|uniref:mandelate racemase/muconate lactonizing enzyme family protein n=1 Tax=Halodesulfurarchaeum sp. TaxID=1980530 RepID=UPI002FC39F27
MSATIDSFELKLDPPLQTARETLHTRQGVLFQVGTGPTGLGEATPLHPFTESFEACKQALERATKAYTDAGWPRAFRVVSKTTKGRLRYPAARHAVSLAALDLEAKQQETPLYRLLGGQATGQVPVNATIGDGTATETAQRAGVAKRAGFPAIKLKVGAGSIDRDVRRLRSVRETVGSHIELRADANGAWNRADAQQFLSETASFGLSYVEQPLPVEQTRAHGQLRGSGTGIALDESIAETVVTTLLRKDVADVYVLKPMAIGGIDIARGLTKRVRQAGATPVVTSIFESVVGRMGAVHLAASLENLPPSGLATAERFETDLAPDPAPVRNGAIEPPTDPGLGIEGVTIDG